MATTLKPARSPWWKRFIRSEHLAGWSLAGPAVFLIGFVVVYGSVLQSRVEAGLTRRGREDSGVDTEIA